MYHNGQKDSSLFCKKGVNAEFLTPQSAESAIAVFFEIFNEACAIGQIMEEQNQQIVEQAHKQETALPKGTKTIAVGLDGVNIMLREKEPRSGAIEPGQDTTTRRFMASPATKMRALGL